MEAAAVQPDHDRPADVPGGTRGPHVEHEAVLRLPLGPADPVHRLVARGPGPAGPGEVADAALRTRRSEGGGRANPGPGGHRVRRPEPAGPGRRGGVGDTQEGLHPGELAARHAAVGGLGDRIAHGRILAQARPGALCGRRRARLGRSHATLALGQVPWDLGHGRWDMGTGTWALGHRPRDMDGPDSQDGGMSPTRLLRPRTGSAR